jgi:hypothetical protein
MPDIVSYHLQAAYHDTIFSYASKQEQQLAPHCIVEPTTTLDVSKTVFVLSYLAEQAGPYQYAKDCLFAVKGGGQNPIAGAANIQAGVTIDLHRINSVNVARNRVVPINGTDLVNTTVVNIGGGATWDEVYQKLDRLEFSVAGGRVAGLGVGGLTLGGMFHG